MDMSKFIAARSDQLNADDLLGGPRTITVTQVRGTDAADQPVAVHYEGDQGKPFKPCKTMRRAMVACWGKDAQQYVGRSMTLYCDPEVQFGGMKVGGIRISHMSHIEGEKKLALTQTRGKKGLVTVRPLQAQQQQQDAGPTIDDVRQALAGAAKQGEEALRTEWARKTTAPFREALTAELADWKREAAEVDASRAPADTNDDGGYSGA